MPTKRKAKVKGEVGVKVPHNIRQRYVNLFVEEFLKTSATVPEAFEKVWSKQGAFLPFTNIIQHLKKGPHNTSNASLVLHSQMYIHIFLYTHIH